VAKSRQYRAVNTASSSKNTIHDDKGARRQGLARALVPATALLAFVLATIREDLGDSFGEQGSAAVRFSAPVYDGQLLKADTERIAGGVAFSFTATDGDGPAVTGQARLGNDLYQGSHPALVPATGLPARPMSGGDLIGDERLNSTTVDTSLAEIRTYLEATGLNDTADSDQGVPTEFLVAGFVRYLRANFVRRRPSMYAGVHIHCLRRCEIGEPLQLRGRIDRLYSRRGRQFMMIETGWFDDAGEPVLWALHNSVYALGPEAD
jgi:hypothetical protein